MRVLMLKLMKQVPILFLSDSPDLPTGLGRITRDLAGLVTRDLPQYRVGTYGRAGNGSKAFPWAQYNFAPTVEDQWGATNLTRVWEDFAGSEAGIMMTIHDPSRVDWFSRSEPYSALGKLMHSGKVQKWGYFPIDSTGPNDRLTGSSCWAVSGYDRVLAYTKFGAGVLARSISNPDLLTRNGEVDWIPHGLDMNTFKPRDRKAARVAMGMKDDDLVVGVNMTNQPRKDWGLAFTIAAMLRDRHPNFKLWAHTDSLDRHWHIPSLVEDLGLDYYVKMTFTGDLDDEALSYFYSACDVTMLPSLGEGWGFPITESLACGVACFHGACGGGSEQLTKAWIIDPVGFRYTDFNSLRPVFDPQQWALEMDQWFDAPLCGDIRYRVEHLSWDKLWPSTWKKWFEAGLA